MRVSRELERLEQEMAEASEYASWCEVAQAHDRVSGALAWREKMETALYDWRLLRARVRLLRKLRKGRDIPRLVFYLHEELHGNLGNMANPRLYAQARFGTKSLIGDYLDEVVGALDDLRDSRHCALHGKKKERFFRQAAHSFGRSGLLLSGGATLGLFHLGVIRALWEEEVLPTVISGSSAGSIVAAVVATHTNAQLSSIFNPGYVRLQAWRDFGLESFFEGRGLGDIKKLRSAINRNVPAWTFEETRRRTGRIVNISVSPADANQFPRLLGYMNAPNVFVRRAALASCAIPGLFPPVALRAKNFDGRAVPYMPKSQWIDGTLKMDVPKQHIARMHNVNHFIVSQTNPHVLPFMSDHETHSSALFALDLAKSTARANVEHILDRLRKHVDSAALALLLDKAHSIASQAYTGDITIHPSRQISNLLRTFIDPSDDHVADFVDDGERAAWPQIERIRNATRISRAFEQVMQQLGYA